MRLTTFILMIALAQVSARGFGQKITLNEINAPIEKILQSIKSQSGYGFIYNVKDLDNRKVTLQIKDATIEEAVKSLTKDLQLSYKIVSKDIVLTKEEPSLLDKIASVVQSVTKDLNVRGVVKDQDGKPLPNASIRIKGKNTVINTNSEGEFEIKNVAEDAVLVISYVGYKTLEINLKDATIPLQIKLNVQTGQLEEVNVSYSTGYENIPKERATGSFVQIDNKLFNRAVGATVLDRLLNVTSGLRFESGEGISNGNDVTNITIRGMSTINANIRPLIVVDGFPYEEQYDANNQGSIANRNPLYNLNPNDVESITILRDAAAASIWGARSSNGVIVITTKRGKYNQPVNVSFNSNVTLIEKPRLNKMQVINPIDAIEIDKQLFATGIYDVYDDVLAGFGMFNFVLSPAVEIMLAARKRNSGMPGYKAEEDPAVLAELTTLGSHDVREDISKYLLQTTVNQQYAFNISGGTDKMKYYGSVGYDDNLPVERGNKSNRLTLNFNNTYRPIKKLELNTYIVYTKSKNVSNGVGYADFLPGGPNSILAPYTQLADANGSPLHVPRRTRGYRTPYLDTASYPRLLDWHHKPLDEVQNNDNLSNLYNTRFGGGLKYELSSCLSINLSSQYEKSLSNANNLQNLSNYTTRDLINLLMQAAPNGTILYPVPLGGILDYSNSEQTNWNVRGQLTFNKSWGKHRINAIAGSEASERITNSKTGRFYGYDPNTGLAYTNIDFKSNFPTRATGGGIRNIASNTMIGGNLDRFTNHFANAGYTFDGKYTITGSGRFDASNFFGSKANQRVTPLWSTGAAWNIAKEEFFKLRWLPMLKLSATYGYNANLNNKATALPTARYNPANGDYHNENFLQLITPPNPGLTWEKNRMVNLKLEYGIFDQRISGSIEYYARKGINLIGAKLIEPTVGVTQYTGNYASMQSKGFDVTLNSVNLNGEFKWISNINISYNTDKITAYEISELSQNTVGNYFDPRFTVLDKPLFKIYSYKSAGLNSENGNPRGYVNGEIKDFQDVLDQARPSDLLYHGSAVPKIFGSLVNTVDYKNFSISFNISFKLGYYLRKTPFLYSAFFNSWGNVHADYYKRWQNPGDEQFTQVPSQPQNYDGRDAFYGLSNAQVIKGDHIRFNDIRLSYNLNKSNFKALPLANASFYIYANNLGILWRANKDGVDPDNPNTALPPIQRSLAIGLTFNL